MIININKFYFLFLKKIGSKNKANNENLCKYEPAINSSPNGPDNLLVSGDT